MGNQFSQAFPPAPTFTEKSLGSLAGKIYIVTGANAGVGKELARILYSLNSTVYVAARSSEKAAAAIEWIKSQHPNSTGTLHYLSLDLGDLTTIKRTAQEFLSKETRLDVLFNNAGVMTPPQGSLTAQNHELQIGTNCVGPFLLTKLLTPILAATAANEIPGTVRVIWVSSSAAHLVAPKGGVDMTNISYKTDKSKETKYAVSKAGNVLHALEYSRRHASEGIVSIVLNPGNLASDLQRHLNSVQAWIVSLMTYPPVNGAYTELFAGLSPEGAALEQSEWIIPFGRVGNLRKDLVETVKEQGNGPVSGRAAEFWEWTEEQVKAYV